LGETYSPPFLGKAEVKSTFFNWKLFTWEARRRKATKSSRW